MVAISQTSTFENLVEATKNVVLLTKVQVLDAFKSIGLITGEGRLDFRIAILGVLGTLAIKWLASTAADRFARYNAGRRQSNAILEDGGSPEQAQAAAGNYVLLSAEAAEEKERKLRDDRKAAFQALRIAKAKKAAKEKAEAKAEAKVEKDAKEKAAADAKAKKKAEQEAKKKAGQEAKKKAYAAKLKQAAQKKADAQAKKKAAQEAKKKAAAAKLEQAAQEKAATQAKKKEEEDAATAARAEAERAKKAATEAAARASEEEEEEDEEEEEKEENEEEDERKSAAPAAAAEEKRIADEAAAAEKQRIADEAAAKAEEEAVAAAAAAAEAEAEVQRLAKEEAAAAKAAEEEEEAAAAAAAAKAEEEAAAAAAAAAEAEAEVQRLAKEEAAAAKAAEEEEEAAAAAAAAKAEEAAAAAAAAAAEAAAAAVKVKVEAAAEELAQRAVQQAALREEYLQRRAAAAEKQRLADEAAAAEEQRITDEAAAEEQRLAGEALPPGDRSAETAQLLGEGELSILVEIEAVGQANAIVPDPTQIQRLMTAVANAASAEAFEESALENLQVKEIITIIRTEFANAVESNPGAFNYREAKKYLTTINAASSNSKGLAETIATRIRNLNTGSAALVRIAHYLSRSEVALKPNPYQAEQEQNTVRTAALKATQSWSVLRNYVPQLPAYTLKGEAVVVGVGGKQQHGYVQEESPDGQQMVNIQPLRTIGDKVPIKVRLLDCTVQMPRRGADYERLVTRSADAPTLNDLLRFHGFIPSDITGEESEALNAIREALIDNPSPSASGGGAGRVFNNMDFFRTVLRTKEQDVVTELERALGTKSFATAVNAVVRNTRAILAAYNMVALPWNDDNTDLPLFIQELLLGTPPNDAVFEESIRLVMQQTAASRANAIKALGENDNVAVEAIMVIEEAAIRLVMQQTEASRANAIKALGENDNDVVEAIMAIEEAAEEAAVE